MPTPTIATSSATTGIEVESQPSRAEVCNRIRAETHKRNCGKGHLPAHAEDDRQRPNEKRVNERNVDDLELIAAEELRHHHDGNDQKQQQKQRLFPLIQILFHGGTSRFVADLGFDQAVGFNQ